MRAFYEVTGGARGPRGRAARGAFAILLCSTIATSCSSPEGSEASRSEPAEKAWITYDDSGISLEHPEEWTTASDPARGSVTVTGPGDVELLVLPFFSPSPFGEEQARAALTDLDEAQGIDWRSLDVGGDGVAMAEGTEGDRRAIAVVTWSSAERGSAGYIYLGSAPEERVADARADWARVIDSVTIEGTSDVTTPEPTYEKWTDPAEGAFSVELPTGWTAEGGTTRPCPTLVQASVTGRSPDGDSLLFMGDTFPFFTEPVPSLGLVEGGTYPHPCGYASPIASYVPATDYFMSHILPDVAPRATVVRAKALPQLADQLVTIGINSYDAGEVEYVSVRGGVEYRGITTIVNERIAAGGGANWHVWRLYLAQSPAAEYPEVLAHGLQMAGSFSIDPRWAQMQAGLTAQQTQIIADMAASTSDSISEGYWGRQAVLDELSLQRSNATLEVDDFVDPVTGEHFSLEFSPEHYWISSDGTIVGTDTQTQPDVDFRELLRVHG